MLNFKSPYHEHLLKEARFAPDFLVYLDQPIFLLPLYFFEALDE
jgi:hypothetical protein